MAARRTAAAMSLPKPINADVDPNPMEQSAGDTALAEIGGDLQAALARYMNSTLGEWRTLLADVEKRYEVARWRSEEEERDNIKGMLEYTRFAVNAFERMATEAPPKQDHLTPADFSWYDVSAAWAH